MSRGYLSALLTHWSRESNTRELSAEVMDLLQKMLYKDPQHRLSLRQVCSHPWFQMEE
jgi:serine/threonine protein kinase